jgi:D-glycero-D-manno-heptose 1,7-bisphosphate phosphatase
MQIDKMWQRFGSSGASAMLTVYSNKDAYTRNCVRVEPDGFISMYDKSCRQPALNGVEISYAILTQEIVRRLSTDNVSFESTIYPALIANRELAAFLTDHRYVSVGSPQRLPLTKEFFSRRKTVLLDRDGVLNRKPPRAEYVSRWKDFEWLPGAQTALRLLRENGYRVVVISNQAGIGRGMMTDEDLAAIHHAMAAQASAAGGRIDAIYYCPHDWDAGCECRKPRPGMLFRAQRELTLDLSRTFFIGDDERDAAAAESAGCPFAMISEERPLLHWVRDLLADQLKEEQHGKASFNHRA